VARERARFIAVFVAGTIAVNLDDRCAGSAKFPAKLTTAPPGCRRARCACAMRGVASICATDAGGAHR
jgi:hypothetical protein